MCSVTSFPSTHTTRLKNAAARVGTVFSVNEFDIYLIKILDLPTALVPTTTTLWPVTLLVRPMITGVSCVSGCDCTGCESHAPMVQRNWTCPRTSYNAQKQTRHYLIIVSALPPTNLIHVCQICRNGKKKKTVFFSSFPSYFQRQDGNAQLDAGARVRCDCLESFACTRKALCVGVCCVSEAVWLVSSFSFLSFSLSHSLTLSHSHSLTHSLTWIQTEGTG